MHHASALYVLCTTSRKPVGKILCNTLLIVVLRYETRNKWAPEAAKFGISWLFYDGGVLLEAIRSHHPDSPSETISKLPKTYAATHNDILLRSCSKVNYRIVEGSPQIKKYSVQKHQYWGTIKRPRSWFKLRKNFEENEDILEILNDAYRN